MVRKAERLLFPEVVHEYIFDDIDCDKIVEQLKKEEYVPIESTDLHHSIHSTITKNPDTLDKFPKLKDKIMYAIKDVVNIKCNYEHYFKICDSWGTKTKPGGFSSRHYHTHSMVSGVFYPMPDCQIRFYRPRTDIFWSIEPTEYNDYNSKSSTTPKLIPGTLILFPSYMEHQIVKYEGKEDRYSIAFNVVPKGRIGNSTQRLIICDE